MPAPEALNAGDVGGEEVDSVAVEVAPGAVVVLGGPGVGMAGEDLGVAERDAGVEGVGDRRMPQRVRADVTGDPGSLRDPRDHSVGIAAVDRLARHRSQDQRTGGPFAAAGLQDSEDRDGQWHGRGLVALAHQVQDPVTSEGLGIVFDANRGGLGGS